MNNVEEYIDLIDIGKCDFINSYLSEYLKWKIIYKKDINFEFAVFYNCEEVKIEPIKNIGYSVERNKNL